MNPVWQQLAQRANMLLTQQQLDRLSTYIHLLLAANREMNLTRIDTIESAEVGHVGDALTVLPHLPKASFTLADVGSGGGVPGIPLAISRPDSHVLLIESTQKKAVFLENAVRQIGLTNVRVSSKRAEDEARGDSREKFDIVTARALAAMNVLVEWCLPLTRVGGKVLAMKGGKISEELPAATRAIRTLGGSDAMVHPVDLPGADYHVVVEVRKVQGTDKKYPRPTAVTKDKPL